MTSIKEKIESLKPHIKHIRTPIKVKSEDWKETADQWMFIFPLGLTFNFFSGIGHRESNTYDKSEYQRLKNAHLTDYGLEQFIKVSKPKKPKVEDLLYSLSSDSTAEEMSFKQWAAEFGFSNDSISALQTYLACQENAEKLRKLGFDNLPALRAHFHDY